MPEIGPSDPFSSLDDFRRMESILLGRTAKPDGARAPKEKFQPEKFRYHQFPANVLYDVLKLVDQNNCSAAAIILAVLYEEWWKSFKRNPVRLSSRKLKAHGISKYPKTSSLKAFGGDRTHWRRTGTREKPLDHSSVAPSNPSLVNRVSGLAPTG